MLASWRWCGTFSAIVKMTSCQTESRTSGTVCLSCAFSSSLLEPVEGLQLSETCMFDSDVLCGPRCRVVRVRESGERLPTHRPLTHTVRSRSSLHTPAHTFFFKSKMTALACDRWFCIELRQESLFLSWASTGASRLGCLAMPRYDRALSSESKTCHFLCACCHRTGGCV